jgi:hypothetical protein
VVGAGWPVVNRGRGVPGAEGTAGNRGAGVVGAWWSAVNRGRGVPGAE